MVFSSTVFMFLFLPAVMILYYIVPRKVRNLILFISSLVFYAWGEPVYVFLMIVSTVVAYITGLLADKAVQGRKPWVPKLSLLVAILWNMGLLLFFKYTNFFISNANDLFGMNIKLLGLELPIGISFYSFQTLSYVIDVYRGNVAAQKNYLTLGTYVALFPQLIAGPIVRYKDVAEQLAKRKETLGQFAEGVKRFAIGMGKKVLLANSVGALFEAINATPQKEMSVTAAWLGIIAYTFQIYFDFSGYSDMAIGLGKMFGFDFLENFNYPYISDSITEFWRRWHMSLSSWFRDYVYIPLGGNRKGKLRQCVNIMIVWFLTGFWHGANWNFMIWGVYFGVILLLEKLFLLKVLSRIPKLIGHVYALILIVIGWGIFAFDDFGKLAQNFKNMFGVSDISLINDKAIAWLAGYAVTFVILIAASTPVIRNLGNFVKNGFPVLYSCILQPAMVLSILVLSTAYLAGSSFNPFLYFRF